MRAWTGLVIALLLLALAAVLVMQLVTRMQEVAS